ncbi:PAS domain S-box protein [Pedobacter sp. PWIIR3]
MTDPTDKRILTEQLIVANEHRLRALVAATSDVIYSISADWKIMRELDGRGFLADAYEPTGDWQHKNVHAEDMEKVEMAIQEAIREKKMFQLEHRVNRLDGSTGWTFSRAVPVLDDEGHILEWFGTASDITDRKLAEEALQKTRDLSEQQKRLYETVTATTPDLMYVFDLNYRFTYANKALLTMWGKDWDNAVGKSLLENGYEPWHAEMHEREIDQVIATRKPIRGEVSFPHAVLGTRYYDYIFTPVFNELGEVEAIAGTTRDITERKQWEERISISADELQAINEEMEATNEEQAASNEELTASYKELERVNYQLLDAQNKIEEGEAALRIAVNAAGLGTFYMNATDRIFVTSAKLKEFFGFAPDEDVPYEAAIDQIHPDYRQQAAAMVESAFSNGSRFDMEYPIIAHNDGKVRWVRGIGEIIRNNGKEYFTGVLHEITEKKQDEIRKNDFIGMVSHELKTPLTSMKGYIQMLMIKLRKLDDEFTNSSLEKANAQITKMTGMINGFLNVSRLESGKIHMDLAEFDLALLVRETQEETDATISSHKIIFAPVETTIVNADHDKIGQVMHNLISNAVKYSPAGSTINVACETLNGNAQFSVTDRGMGIKPDDISKIFDRYYRVEAQHMFSISGFGIGLYLCAEIIHRHNGKIWAQSEFGQGSTFSFALPVIRK